MSRRAQLLAEMGLDPLWLLRANEQDDASMPEVPMQASAPAAPAELATERRLAPAVPPSAEQPAPATAKPQEAPAQAAPARRPMPPIVLPSAAAPAAQATQAKAAVLPLADVQAAQLDWAGLTEAVSQCTACRLCAQRKQAVFGVGDPKADWLFVGEGPGAEEDARGEPFVGAAGKLLDAMLGAIDLKRGDNVYIANAVKCRPPGNRTPEADEIATCHPYLERQIALIQPKLIVALGRPAAQTLLNTDVKIGAARGKVFDRQGTPVIVTYHPAYLLRNLEDKAKAWEDLCFAQDQMRIRSAD